jgi:hypothetical protein
VDGEGNEIVKISIRETEKKKQGDEKVIVEKEPIMYATPGDPNCPVTSLRKNIQKLNKRCTAFYQYPKANWAESAEWYDNKPLGKNTLGNMMSKISSTAELPIVYTNHCIRSTAITELSNGGVEGNDIVHFTGHKSTESLRHYQLPCDKKNKKCRKF